MSKRGPTYYLESGYYNKLNSFTSRLLAEGFELFSEEFAGIDDFLARVRVEDPDRDAHGLRLTAREKYLLELVSFRIYDELNRDAFNRARDTLIVLPDCLSLHNPDCLMTDGKWGDVCQQCTPDCQANEVCELGERYGVETVFSKRKLSEQIEHYADRSGNLAVVGVACVLMLADGMRTAAEVRVPARGVLLNFTGCKHWNDEPFASEFSLERLRLILEEKYGHADQATDN